MADISGTTARAVKVELYGPNNDGNPRRFTIADGASVSKGQILSLIDARTVEAGSYGGSPAGIAKEEHISGQGVTDISVWTDGIFEMIASGACSAGEFLAFGDAVYDSVTASMATFADPQSFAASHRFQALETAADGEVINVRMLT